MGMVPAEMISHTFVEAIVLVGVLRLKLAGVSGVWYRRSTSTRGTCRNVNIQ